MYKDVQGRLRTFKTAKVWVFFPAGVFFFHSMLFYVPATVCAARGKEEECHAAIFFFVFVCFVPVTSIQISSPTGGAGAA